MLFHILGLLNAFILTAWLSAGVTLTPITVAWGSIWVYVTFALMLIPGYIVAWLAVMLVLFIVGLLGLGVLAGGATAIEAITRRSKRKLF